MLQALIKKGQVLPTDVPAPIPTPGCILIKVVNSCISAGTELTSVTASGISMVKRAMQQPQNIKRIVDLVRNSGVRKTIQKIKEKSNIGSPVGYSVSGIIIGLGTGVENFSIGDRVAAAGAGYANHAEYVSVPKNLVTKLPDAVNFPEASTTTIGGIAMHGVRRAEISLGDFVVVIGAGILGQLAIQLAAAAGARIIAIDINNARLNLAQKSGAQKCINSTEQDAAQLVVHYTNGHGADSVLFCAATAEEKVLSQAFVMARKKGRVVMVGVYGDRLNRSDIYRKEIDFLISTSYGPGRYDTNYEEKGIDYPYAYVRWTENRNMQEYLRLLADRKIDLGHLIGKKFAITDVKDAFIALTGSEKPLIILLEYGDIPAASQSYSLPVNKIGIKTSKNVNADGKIRVGIIGAGNFAKSTHLPNLFDLKSKYTIRAICDRDGANAEGLANHYGANYATTDYNNILTDPDIDLTMICTRHHLHGNMVLESLQAGKHTFVEKPLCTRIEELEQIEKLFSGTSNTAMPILMVGFNRRFSQYATEIKKHTAARINPLFIHYRMNAGYLPLDHWVYSEEGGGRIVGEACHIIDLFSFFIGNPVTKFHAASIFPNTNSISGIDNKSITIEYKDGSIATLHYFSTGAKDLPKEYMEIHFDGKSIIMDNYQSLTFYGSKGKSLKSATPEKGGMNELFSLNNAIYNSQYPIPLEQIFETTRITLSI